VKRHGVKKAYLIEEAPGRPIRIFMVFVLSMTRH